LVPAAAVIPTPGVYGTVAAVKGCVAGPGGTVRKARGSRALGARDRGRKEQAAATGFSGEK